MNIKLDRLLVDLHLRFIMHEILHELFGTQNTSILSLIFESLLPSSSLAVGDAGQDPLDIRFGHVVNIINTNTRTGKNTE